MRDKRQPFKPSTFLSHRDFPELLFGSAGPLEPPEPWELPYCNGEGGSCYRWVQDAFPRRPRDTEDLPAGALESLRGVCGLEGLQQLFIIPWAVRSVGWKDQRVISPKSILALGSRAVGLWTEKPDPGVKIVIDLEELSAIEDRMILLYGRLSFRYTGDRLTIRYNTLARTELEPALLELRSRWAGSRRSIPREDCDG
jgi:hypothetical protein